MISLKALIQSNYIITNPIWRLVCPGSKRNIIAPRDIVNDDRETFRDIYLTNNWKSLESVSGVGSTLSATIPLRRQLPKLLTQLNVKTLLDAPCGDFNWMKHVALPGINYLGADIVPELVDSLALQYGSDNRSFSLLNIVDDPMPKANIWLCRDVLFHLPTADVLKVLTRFADSDIGYLLTSTYPLSTANPDIESGGFRTINLRLPPYSLPKPLEEIDDYVPAAPPRILGLWSVQQMQLWRDARIA